MEITRVIGSHVAKRGQKSSRVLHRVDAASAVFFASGSNFNDCDSAFGFLVELRTMNESQNQLYVASIQGVRASHTYESARTRVGEPPESSVDELDGETKHMVYSHALWR